MKKILFPFVFLMSLGAFAQTGVIKGIILDKQSESPLEGATVELLNAEVATGVISDFDGRFTLEDVPIGRQALRISFIGFESSTIPNLEVTTGKDVFITVSLLESFNALD